MRPRDKRIILQVGGILLLLLAFSPFTAPFSTIDPIHIFGAASSDGGAVPQSKHAHDGLTTLQAAPAGCPDYGMPRAFRAAEAPRPGCALNAFRIPLRI